MNIYIILGVFLTGTFLGWRGEVWHQSYQTQKIEEKTIVNLGKGESNIINFNQALDKVKVDVQDCAYKPINAGYLKLLNQPPNMP